MPGALCQRPAIDQLGASGHGCITGGMREHLDYVELELQHDGVAYGYEYVYPKPRRAVRWLSILVFKISKKRGSSVP